MRKTSHPGDVANDILRKTCRRHPPSFRSASIRSRFSLGGVLQRSRSFAL